MNRRAFLFALTGCAVAGGSSTPAQPWFTVSMRDEFGEHPSCKDAMRSFVACVVVRSLSHGQRVRFDFQGTRLPSHGFLHVCFHASALAAIRSGMNPYKQLRVVNADKVVRDTFDFILDRVDA